MNAEIITLRDKRVHGGEFTYGCGICGSLVSASIRFDHFPSCMSCRHFCECDKAIQAHYRAVELGITKYKGGA